MPALQGYPGRHGKEMSSPIWLPKYGHTLPEEQSVQSAAKDVPPVFALNLPAGQGMGNTDGSASVLGQ